MFKQYMENTLYAVFHLCVWNTWKINQHDVVCYLCVRIKLDSWLRFKY